ncbi:MAG: DUF305 domain-containing protein [Aquabacterium sp.]|uniref:DUF305 domain-containing protein n=1 Tax=Aquabacterium sp. TaxID=1872578 RepID=UPI003BAE4FAA
MWERLDDASPLTIKALAPDGAGASLPVNVGFSQSMTVHHEQALVMARMALTQGTLTIRSIATGIINQQLKEVGYMQGWLMLWSAPPIESNIDDMRWMKEAYANANKRDPAFDQFLASCVPGKEMPGIASQTELEQLSALRDDSFDRQFLLMMIRHHQGALVMARFAMEHAENEAVRLFARAIATEQRREMAQMTGLLMRAAQ